MTAKQMWRTAAAMAAMLWCGSVWAQTAPPEGEAPADTPPTDAAAPAEPGEPAELTDDSATAAEQDLERDLALFWGKRREVQVVQKRLFEKDGGVELMLFGGTIPNDDFIIYAPVGARLGYYFSEAFSVQGSFAYAIDNNTELTTFLVKEIGLKEADIQETIEFYYNVNLLWSPVYGKLSLLGLKLTHFDTYVGVGFGAFHTTTVNPADQVENQEIKAAGNTVFGFRWFVTDYFNIQTDYRHYFFPKFQGGVSTPIELSLGLAFLL